jgi:high-affinity iron transporter
MGTWFSLFPDWPTFLGQFIAFALVIGSYLGAQYLRVWRPRRRGQQAAQMAKQIPDIPADVAVAAALTGPALTAQSAL